MTHQYRSGPGFRGRFRDAPPPVSSSAVAERQPGATWGSGRAEGPAAGRRRIAATIGDGDAGGDEHVADAEHVGERQPASAARRCRSAERGPGRRRPRCSSSRSIAALADQADRRRGRRRHVAAVGHDRERGCRRRRAATSGRPGDPDVAQQRDEDERGRRDVEGRPERADPVATGAENRTTWPAKPAMTSQPNRNWSVARPAGPAAERQPDEEADDDGVEDEHRCLRSAADGEVTGRAAGRSTRSSTSGSVAAVSGTPSSRARCSAETGRANRKPWPNSQPSSRSRSSWSASSIPSATIRSPSVWPRATIAWANAQASGSDSPDTTNSRAILRMSTWNRRR